MSNDTDISSTDAPVDPTLVFNTSSMFNHTSTFITTLVNASKALTTTTEMPSPVGNTTTNATVATISTSLGTTMTSHVTNATPTPVSDSGSSPGVIFISCIIFLVAVALVAKVIVSNRKKRADLIGGSARWRLAASQQSGAGPARTAASYVPMNNRERPGAGGLDSTGPGDNSVDWERQFFDDTEPTVNFSRPVLPQKSETCSMHSL